MIAGLWIRGPNHCPGLLCTQVELSESWLSLSDTLLSLVEMLDNDLAS